MFSYFKKMSGLRKKGVYPQMSLKETYFIMSHLKKDDVMLEWGAGGSTLHFAKYVRTYYSIEHSREWFEFLSPIVRKNVRLFHIPQNGDYPNQQAYNTHGDGTLTQFSDYVHASDIITEAPTVVLVDGRTRVECLNHLYPRITPDIKIFIHDFERYEDALTTNFAVQQQVDSLALLRRSSE